jgi:hypothetical protein
VGAERDRERRLHRAALDGAGVGVDPARQVDGDDVAAAGALGQGGGRLPECSAAADAHQPVDDEVGTVDVGCGPGAAAGGVQGREGVVPRLADQHRHDLRAAAGQPRPGPQRVGPVVARADQQHHPRAVDARQPGSAGDGQPLGRALHERAGRQHGHQRGLGSPHLRGGVRPDHAPRRVIMVRPGDGGALAGRTMIVARPRPR